MLGHYSFTLASGVKKGQLRPLKRLTENEGGP
jgi:hypothetical protein